MKKVLLFSLIASLTGENLIKAAQEFPQTYQETYAKTIREAKRSVKETKANLRAKNEIIRKQDKLRRTKIACVVAAPLSVAGFYIAGNSFREGLRAFKSSSINTGITETMIGALYLYTGLSGAVLFYQSLNELNSNK